MKKCKPNIKLSEFVSQVVNVQREKILALIKAFLERCLVEYRDQFIGNRFYERNNSLKRYGYRIRKYITCLYGMIERVRLPRIRAKEHSE